MSDNLSGAAGNAMTAHKQNLLKCAMLHGNLDCVQVQSGLEAAQRRSDCVQAHAFVTAMMVARQHLPLHALDPVRYALQLGVDIFS